MLSLHISALSQGLSQVAKRSSNVERGAAALDDAFEGLAGHVRALGGT